MAQIVLVYPLTGLDVRGLSVWLPLSALAVAAGVADSYDVAVIDQRVDPDWPRSLKRALGADTLCVGISSMTGAQIRHGLAAARLVRDAAPDLPIVWGGNHPTLAAAQTAEHPLVDIVVIGAGERTFRLLVDALRAGKDWRGVPNIAYKSEGGAVLQGEAGAPEDPEQLAELPYQLVDVENYVSGRMLFGRPVRSLPFITSFGCPHACAFCCQPVLSSRRWRRMSPEHAARRASVLAERYRLDAVEFHDEEFFADRDRGLRIAERIGGAFSWYVQTRMDDLLALDLAALEKNGLSAVQPGLESGSDRVLEFVRKQETVRQYRAANAALARTGIEATYNFMMGFPTETPPEVAATVDLALELLDANPNARVSGFYVFVPYPGSELYALAVKAGFAPPRSLEDWSLFTRHHISAPWIADREPLEYLMLTSKLIDGRRWRNVVGNPLARGLLSRLSRRYRADWKRHRFKMTWDTRLLELLASRTFGRWT
ncbi:MAG: radical SAM protein [Elusimicrobia bacterium]|nr:radical SAM protein [Elusimicrobiota bacterium]